MLRRTLLIFLVALTLLVGTSSTLLAVSSEVRTADDTPSEALLEMSSEDFEKAVMSMSEAERLDASRKRIEAMRGSAAVTEGLVEKERKLGTDVKVINCINKKLINIKGFLKVAESAYTKQSEAAKENDTTGMLHHYKLIALGSQKVAKLEEEAKLCTGTTDNNDNSGQAQVTVNPNVVPISPVLPGGYTQLEDIFSEIYDATGLTPLR